MKKILLTLLMAVFMLAASNAQDSTRHQHFKSLNLTDDQKNQIAALQKEHHSKFMAILTPEQRTQFEKQKQEMKTRRKQRTPGEHKRIKTQQPQTPKETVKSGDENLVKANQALAKAELNKQSKAQQEAGLSDCKVVLDSSQQAVLEEMKSRRSKPAGS